jgi:hypothetical protein
VKIASVGHCAAPPGGRICDIPNAPIGEWKYTVTPLEVKYPNFAFVLTIAE